MTGTLVRPAPGPDLLARVLRRHRPAVPGLGLGVAARGDGSTVAVEGDYRLAGRMSPQRRVEFLLGRGALRRAMADARLPAADALPAVAGRPLLPPGVVGALAHSGGVAVALAGSGARFDTVGVDLEFSPLPVEAGHLVLMGEEREWLAAAPDPETAERWLLAAFCAKEAAFKAFAQLPGSRVERLRQVRLRPDGRAFVCRPEHGRDPAVRVCVHRIGVGVFAWTVVPRKGVV